MFLNKKLIITGTFESLSDASNFVETVEKRQGYKIACLEEIALNQGWISEEELTDKIKKSGKTSYNDYLLSIIENNKKF